MGLLGYVFPAKGISTNSRAPGPQCADPPRCSVAATGECGLLLCGGLAGELGVGLAFRDGSVVLFLVRIPPGLTQSGDKEDVGYRRL